MQYKKCATVMICLKFVYLVIFFMSEFRKRGRDSSIILNLVSYIIFYSYPVLM